MGNISWRLYKIKEFRTNIYKNLNITDIIYSELLIYGQ